MEELVSGTPWKWAFFYPISVTFWALNRQRS